MSKCSIKNSFASDNISSACPQVIQALIDANTGIASSYATDKHSHHLNAQFSELFETPVAVFPVMSGTAANALSLSAITPAYGKIYCHQMAHINTDECAAPEFFTGGAKLIAIASEDGKITADSLAQLIRGKGNVHSAQPATLSITQSTETGAIYQLDELASLTATAKQHGLKTHMDGARFANAIAATGASPADMTWRSGVDVLSFGGTKNGCMLAEAVIFFNPDEATAFPFLQKRAGQLISKMRFISAQLEAYIKDDLWLANARHANHMASLLSSGFSAIEGIELAFPTQSNEVFTHLPRAVIDHMNTAGYKVTEGELDETAPPRFVTSWNTQESEVQALLLAARRAVTHCC